MSRFAVLCCCAVALVAGLVIKPCKAKADQNSWTLYSQVVAGTNGFSSADYPAPGARYVQASPLFKTPDMSGTSIGTIYLSCNVIDDPSAAMCVATLKSTNGTDTINVQGYLTLLAANPCASVVSVLGVSGGTGAYNGAQGNVSVTVTAVGCVSTTQKFTFALSLQYPPNAH